MSDQLEKIRHSTAHLLAAAVKQLFPGVKFGIGPAIANGFYYDFDLPQALKPEDLPKIEKKMRELAKRNLAFKSSTKTKTEALNLMADQPYKKELINDLAKQKSKQPLTFYQVGPFLDLCAGPHVANTAELDPFKLLSIAGAYWKGSEKNKMLTRIYGTAFPSQKELDDYLKLQEEIAKRDHRLLNHDLDLYSLSDEVGAGLILWHPNSAIVRNLIENFWRDEHQKRGYQLVFTPHLGKQSLWQKSGHLQFYKESMYAPMNIDEVKYLIKPMNCPFHIQIFRSGMRSYRDLPLRYCELGTVYRYEKAGTLHGLLRVRGFTQDDSHIFCRPDQIIKEVEGVLDLATFMVKSFGFKKFEVDLSVRDPKNKKKYLGDDQKWQQAEKALEEALKKKKLKYRRVEGEAVFYGPKIDFQLIDSLGRGWQGPTIQMDFNFPEKFDLNYIDDQGKKRPVVMIHRTVLGSMERFLGSMVENLAGNFPLWLVPVQIQIIPVGSRHQKPSAKLAKVLGEAGFRVNTDEARETVGYKIRKAEKQKIPYMLVIGDKETKLKSLAVRIRGKAKIQKMTLKQFVSKLQTEIARKK